MSYIGKTPTPAPLTSSDITDGIISTSKIANDAITSAKLGTGDMAFPNGNLVFETASKGIYLGVTSATAANLLDDYEEGTWTPAMTGATSVTNLTGSYTKVGNLVTVWVQMSSGNIGGSPSYIITGLPFTVSQIRSTTSTVASVSVFASNSTSVFGLLPVGNTQIEFLYNRDGTGWSAQNMSTGSSLNLHFSTSYIAN